MKKATLANLLFHWTGAERTGYSGEMAVLKELRRRGVPARRVDGMGYDLIAGAGVKVEVKTSARRKGGGWGFSLRYQNRRCDIIVLRCLSLSRLPCHFVIPRDALSRDASGLWHRERFPTSISIPGDDPWTYEGKWTGYRERWEAIVDLAQEGMQSGHFQKGMM